MNSDDLSVFAQVARSGGISRAALALGTDQSTISRRIGLLETELGVRLFQRTGRGVTLTDHGTQLLGYADSLANLITQAEGAMRESAGHGPASLTIAAQPTIARMLFGRLGHALRERYPHTQIRFSEALASHILGQLADGEIDLALLYLPVHPGTLQFDLLLSEEVHLVTPADHPFQGERFEVSALGEIPLILPSTRLGLRILVEELSVRHGFALNIALECNGSISLTKRLVREGCGCTVLPKAAVADAVTHKALRSFPFNPPVSRDVGIVWPKNRDNPPGFHTVTQIVRHHVIQAVTSGAWPETRLYAGKADPSGISPGDISPGDISPGEAPG